MNVNASIVVPVFNEINLIESFVNNLFETFKNEKVKFIFIDDGSKDGSSVWLKNNLSKIFNDSGEAETEKSSDINQSLEDLIRKKLGTN